jgi:hypothetical protein
MNCTEFDEIVHDLDRPSLAGDGERSAGGTGSQSEAALAHAESCSRCARLLTEVEGLNFALRAIASSDAQLAAPVRLQASLLREFRASAQSNGNAMAKRRIHRWYGAAAIAAMALLGLGLMRVRMGLEPRPTIQNSSTAGTAQAPFTKTPLPMGNAVIRPAATQKNGGDNLGTEDASTFYPLPYADDSASFDGGAVIRVSVPRSALASWGLPVSGIGGSGPIPADVVVSADGTPQAIRLVSESDE